MRSYTQAERCMLLLFAPIAEVKALTPGRYRNLMRALEALGAGGEGDAELTQAELLRLGASVEEAQAILSRLEQTEALDQHLSQLHQKGITLLTRISPEYPRRLRDVLGDHAPMLLYCAGNLALFRTEGIAVVGSRQLRRAGQDFAFQAGRAIAEQGFTYVSGGAVGADTVGYEGAEAGEGSAILFLVDSLVERMEQMAEPLEKGRLLLVSEYSFDQPFSVGRAYSRNRLIHAMGRKVLVAQSDYGSGGTWNGVMENLKGGWSPVFVCSADHEDPGTRGLLERGCCPVNTAELEDLRALGDNQMSIF